MRVVVLGAGLVGSPMALDLAKDPSFEVTVADVREEPLAALVAVNSRIRTRQADLFDDTIEPAAVGLDFDRGYAPRVDKALRERAQTGDAVVRVRVSTVTAKTDGPETTYQLGLQTVERLAGKEMPAHFTIQIDKSSESHGIMKSFESRLVGYGFIAFVREFATPSGERELHFHLAPDTKEVKMAVEEAVLLGRLK